MKQVFILVEGQTEEVIVNDVLVPPARARGFVLTPTVVITSATPTGTHRGGGGWRQYDITRAGGPEQVDHGPATSPSKRLGKVDPNYIKTVTGPLLIAEAGLGAILNRCPTFAAWWQDLLS